MKDVVEYGIELVRIIPRDAVDVLKKLVADGRFETESAAISKGTQILQELYAK